jgi:hypothetical protein
LEYRIKFKFASIYKDLRMVENKITEGDFDEQKIDSQLKDLLERSMSLKVSQFNTKDIYDLLAHIGDVQRRIEDLKKTY